MPFLRLETATPTETEKTIDELKKQLVERDKEIKDMREIMMQIEPIVEFVNSFNKPEQLKTILNYLKGAYSKDDRFRPTTAEFSPYIKDKLDRIAKRKGITQTEALEQLIVEDLELLEKREERFSEIAKSQGLPIPQEVYEEIEKRRLRKKSKRTQKLTRS